MRILLKKVLEKFLLVLFFVVIIFGNIVLIYNLKNKFVNINENYNISDIIDDSKYISIKNVNENLVTSIEDINKKNELKNILENIKIRESKINSIDKDQKIDFSIFIIDSNEKENFINLLNNEIMVNNKIYECDFNISSKLKEIMK